MHISYEQIKMENDASKAVMKWWDNAIPDAVFDTGDDEFFRWTDYVNKSENQKYEENRMLPFADYRENGALDPNHPATAKEVLEDGLLGDIQYNGNFSRQDAPAITVVQNKEGEPVVLRTEDTEYIEAVQSIVVNGNWQALSKDKYSIDKEADTITIEADVFKAGEEYKLTVDATGYKSQSIAFTYDKVLENDLSLIVDYVDDKEAFAAEKKEDSNKTYYFADAEFTVNGSKGDFLKNLKSVTLLSDEEDAVERNIYTKGVSSSNDVYYEVSGDGKKLILHQVQPGTYKLTLRSNYYTEALRCEFVVEKEEEEIPDEQEIEIGASEIRKANGYGEKGYVIQFTYSDGTGMKPSDFAYKKALEEYVKSINSVVVGTTKYSPQSSWTLGDKEYAPDIYDDAHNNYKDSLLVSDSAFNTDGDTTITINADGDYPEVTIVVDKNGNLKQDDEELLDAPTLTGPEKISEGDNLTLTGKDNADELAKYLKAIKVITSDGEELEFKVQDNKLIITTSDLTAGPDGGSIELVIEAKGYQRTENYGLK